MRRDLNDIDFYSLQFPLPKEAREPLVKHKVIDLEAELVGYANTAAIVQQMDLVIAVDTAIVHVAGALNIPVWILVATHADWRWGLEGSDSAWYPSAKLFRQTTLDDWEEVLGQVHGALTELIENKPDQQVV